MRDMVEYQSSRRPGAFHHDEDARAVEAVRINNPELDVMQIGDRWDGDNVVNRIVPYHENGEMAGVTWFAVYYEGDKDDHPSIRVNGKYVSEVYYR